MMANFPILTVLTLFPLVGVVIIAFIDRKNVNVIRWVALVTSIVEFILSIPLYFNFKLGTAQFQFVEKYQWIKAWGASYHVGIDGISLFLVLLTTFLTILSILASWTIEKRVKEYMISFLFLETTMVGVFVALDLLLFYLFWEVMLIPMFLLIGVWGGPRRVYAAIKFFLYTMAGSVLMLGAIIYLYWNHYNVTGSLSFNLFDLLKTPVPQQIVPWLFLAFALAFAIKVPMWPFHTWLPDAHVEAPTAGSVILAGVLLKMGTYGFMRFCMPFFPQAVQKFAVLFLALAVIGIIYGALVALVQEDIKKLVAYSSVSHLGTCMLGLFALNLQSVSGSLLQMINHGISTGALFLLVGMIYDRRHTRLIKEYGGIAKVMPIYATFFMIAMFSSCGLPGLNGFVGEFLTLVGTFKNYPWFAMLGATATIFSAAYLLWMYKRVFFQVLTNPANLKLKDLNFREIVICLMITVPMFWIGLYPKPFLERMQPSVEAFIKLSKGEANAYVVYDVVQKDKKLAALSTTAKIED
ncbi:NADH-quinone oxidoreductase subunit M [Thermosulfidibacter takaii ABI70S6]|uniref:NADH-quinone oxidoreductase subunit M n=1 Tax=Thermosulfidibacter takaii (strain DSM 17441 / JCM 13301 / NBRC 103674 / ABI70S6) TaxID=1298851 RepID=A0A0S3QRQ4_THET7|nr:NADH-quinone oxidoreductase subunit M [Thermosulfidibacter takaii]BAT71019.1 NADH-quinone oxidoreductase subunit M [Thermosulfidibacter takaii ABI70S6]